MLLGGEPDDREDQRRHGRLDHAAPPHRRRSREIWARTTASTVSTVGSGAPRSRHELVARVVDDALAVVAADPALHLDRAAGVTLAMVRRPSQMTVRAGAVVQLGLGATRRPGRRSRCAACRAAGHVGGRARPAIRSWSRRGRRRGRMLLACWSWVLAHQLMLRRSRLFSAMVRAQDEALDRLTPSRGRVRSQLGADRHRLAAATHGDLLDHVLPRPRQLWAERGPTEQGRAEHPPRPVDADDARGLGAGPPVRHLHGDLTGEARCRTDPRARRRYPALGEVGGDLGPHLTPRVTAAGAANAQLQGPVTACDGTARTSSLRSSTWSRTSVSAEGAMSSEPRSIRRVWSSSGRSSTSQGPVVPWSPSGAVVSATSSVTSVAGRPRRTW